MNNDKKTFQESIKVDPVNDQQKVRIYERYVSQQESQFELYINYINEVLCILKDYRIVSDFTRFTARIKSTESAMGNDSKKALDDVFGIEIDFATPGEKDLVSELIKSTLQVGKEKIHDKDNGYQAYHCYGYPIGNKKIVATLEELLARTINPEEEYKKYYDALPKTQKEKEEKKKIVEHFTNLKKNIETYANAITSRIGEKYIRQLKRDLKKAEHAYFEKQSAQIKREGSTNYIPIIEFQSKTIQVAIGANLGEASHEAYKGKKTKAIQAAYEEGIPYSKIPRMYRSYLQRDINGNIKPLKLLSSKETLETLYSGLITIGYERNGGAK